MGKVERSSCPPDLSRICVQCFSPRKCYSGAFPLRINRVESLTRGIEYSCINSFLRHLLSTVSWVGETGYEGWLFLLNVHEKLSCSTSKWTCPPALFLPTAVISAPLPPGYFEEGKRRMDFMTTGWCPANFSFSCHLHERIKWGPLHAESQSRKAWGGNLAELSDLRVTEQI